MFNDFEIKVNFRFSPLRNEDDLPIRFQAKRNSCFQDDTGILKCDISHEKVSFENTNDDFISNDDCMPWCVVHPPRNVELVLCSSSFVCNFSRL